MTTPTPPRDLSTHDAAGVAGTLHTPDPAAVERLRALMAQQPPPRWREATRRQHNGSQIAYGKTHVIYHLPPLYRG